MTNIATIGTKLGKNDKAGATARTELVTFIINAGGLSKEDERKFDMAYVMAREGLRSEAKTRKYFERGATRPENVKTAMDAARKVRERARKDAKIDANDARGGARHGTDKPEAPKKAAATMIPSAVTRQEAAAFLLAYSNKNAKVLPVAVMNAIKKFASDK